jgi:hypothetical protein
MGRVAERKLRAQINLNLPARHREKTTKEANCQEINTAAKPPSDKSALNGLKLKERIQFKKCTKNLFYLARYF